MEEEINTESSIISTSDTKISLDNTDNTNNTNNTNNTDNTNNTNNTNNTDNNKILKASSTQELVSVGEVCTIDFLKNKGFYDEYNYFNNDYAEKNNVKLYNNSTNDSLKKSICSLSEDNKEAYQNCAYKYENPYLINTKIDGINTCTLPSGINIKNSRYKIDGKEATITSEIYFKNNVKNLCEERWHDWFCIPDYHLGNKYYNEVPKDLSNTKSVGTCYIPCPFDYVPRDDIDSGGKCVLKKEFNGGIYDGTFNYIPMAMIYLFGMTQTLFLDKDIGYPKFIDDIHENIIKNDESIMLNNNDNKVNIIDYIKTPENGVLKSIWDDIKEDISKNVNKLHEIIPDINDDFIKNVIVEPNDTNIIRLSKSILTIERINTAYNIAKKIRDYISNINDNPLNNNFENYKEWKRELMLTNPKLTPEQFKNQIKIFKKCVNICFDGKTNYSRNFILYNIKKLNDPIEFNDIDYDPEDEKIIINKYNIKSEKKQNFFEAYIKDFNNILKGVDIYIQLIIISIIIILLYVIYLGYYKDIISFINYIYVSILWIYYDLRGILYYKILKYFNKYSPNDTDVVKKEFIKNKYGKNIDKIETFIKTNTK